VESAHDTEVVAPRIDGKSRKRGALAENIIVLESAKKTQPPGRPQGHQMNRGPRAELSDLDFDEESGLVADSNEPGIHHLQGRAVLERGINRIAYRLAREIPLQLIARQRPLKNHRIVIVTGQSHCEIHT
jgi:hypothetical protein